MTTAIAGLERLSLALRLLNRCIDKVVVVEENCEALVQISDAGQFIKMLDDVEQEVGFAIEVTAHAGGYCLLTVTDRRCR